MTLIFMILRAVRTGLICHTTPSGTPMRVRVSAEGRQLKRWCNSFLTTSILDRLIIGSLRQRNNGSRMEFLCSPALSSLQILCRRSNGDCFLITVVIRLIGHGVGFRSQKF